MSQLIRREAICTLAGGVAALFGSTQIGQAASTDRPHDQQVVLATGTLTPDNVQGRKMVGFLETQVEGGQAFLSLVSRTQRTP